MVLLVPFIRCKAQDINIIEPYLLNVTPTSIQIHWEIEAGQSLIKYGKDKKLDNEIIIPTKNQRLLNFIMSQLELKKTGYLVPPFVMWTEKQYPTILQTTNWKQPDLRWVM